MATDNTNMRKEQERYNRDLDQRVGLPQNKVRIVSRVITRKYFHATEDRRHKLAPIATGPYRVT